MDEGAWPQAKTDHLGRTIIVTDTAGLTAELGLDGRLGIGETSINDLSGNHQ